MLLIPLDAAGSDLPSLSVVPLFPPANDGSHSGKVHKVPELFHLF